MFINYLLLFLNILIFTSGRLIKNIKDELNFCIKSNQQCVNPHFNIQSRYRLDIGILCYLKKPSFIEAYPKISDPVWAYKICVGKNKLKNNSRSKSNVEDEEIYIGYGDAWRVKNSVESFDKFVIVRDPIERFISAFIDKCIVEKWGKYRSRCFGCKNNINCVVKKIYNIFINFKEKNINPNYFINHFNLQIWSCNMMEDLKKYKYILYPEESKNLESFYNNILNILMKHSVTTEELVIISMNLKNNFTPHTTKNLTIRDKIKKNISQNKLLKKLLLKIYYYDYFYFNLPLPSWFI
uniref:Sulfotransfer_1 domain-containing protein n=1 Tax=Parastrongyloides trichosuri TaxID=131310 RepID=A0A0N4ZWD2_PARTI